VGVDTIAAASVIADGVPAWCIFPLNGMRWSCNPWRFNFHCIGMNIVLSLIASLDVRGCGD